jgi:hypothetical protein
MSVLILNDRASWHIEYAQKSLKQSKNNRKNFKSALNFERKKDSLGSLEYLSIRISVMYIDFFHWGVFEYQLECILEKKDSLGSIV